MAQLWENSPHTNVARVQILASTQTRGLGWVCCWFPPFLREVFLGVLLFSPPLKNQRFQIPVWPGRGRTSLWSGCVSSTSLFINLICIFYLWQLRCYCNPCHNKFTSLSNQERSNTTVVAMFPNLCFWRRSLCSNLKGIDPEKSYRATLKRPLIKMFRNDAPYGSIISVYRKIRENNKRTFCFSDLFIK